MGDGHLRLGSRKNIRHIFVSSSGPSLVFRFFAFRLVVVCPIVHWSAGWRDGNGRPDAFAVDIGYVAGGSRDEEEGESGARGRDRGREISRRNFRCFSLHRQQLFI
jgi:hypothetical protein